MTSAVACIHHGQTPGQLVCPELFGAMRANISLPPFRRIQVNIGDGFSKLSVCACGHCISGFGLDDNVQLSLDEEWVESMYPKLMPVCPDCFALQTRVV